MSIYNILLIILAIFSVLPLYLWRKTRKIALIVLCIYIAKMFSLRDFFFDGRLSVCHDAADLQYRINIVRQWVMSQVPLDWNPFIAAGQPMSVMSNMSFYVPVIILSKLLLLVHRDLGTMQFSRLFYFSLVLQFWTGSILLFQVLYNRKAISVIGGWTVVFSGFFVESLYEPGISHLYFFPYLLFFLVHSFKTGRWAGSLFFSVFIGSAFAHYNPTYVVIFFAVFLASLIFPANNSFLGLWLKRLFSDQPVKILYCVILFMLTFGPTLYSFKELGDFVSPSRGYTVRGTLTSTNTGATPGVSAPFETYLKLFNGSDIYWARNLYAYGHNNYYIGALSFLLLFFVPLLWKDSLLRGFIISAVGLGVLAAKSSAPLWDALVDNIPLFNMIRITSFFSYYQDFICIVIAVGAIKILLDRAVPLGNKLFSVSLMVFFLVLIRNYVPESAFHLLAGALCMIVLASIMAHQKTLSKGLVKDGGIYSKAVSFFKDPTKIILAALFAFQVYDLGSFSANEFQNLCWATDYPLKEIRHPTTWQSMCFDCKAEVPADTWPIIDKEIIWGHPKDVYIYFMDKDFSVFWRKVIQPRGIFFGDVFHVIPSKSDALAWSGNPQFDDSYKKDFVELLNSAGEFEKVEQNYLRSAFNLESSGEVKLLPTNNPNQLSLLVKAERDSYLFRMENHHPGWRAFVDGKETVIEKVSPFQLIPISQGQHKVTFEFHTAYPLLVDIATFSIIIGWGFMMFWLKNGAQGTLNIKLNEIKSKRFLLFVISAAIIVWAPFPAISQPYQKSESPDAIKSSYFADPDRTSLAGLQARGIPSDAEYAFDVDKNTLWKTIPQDGPGRAWIARSFDVPKKVAMFTLTIRQDTNEEAPPAMMVFGSMDGEHWDIIGYIHQLTWAKGETKAFTIQNLKQAYKYYKFKFDRHSDVMSKLDFLKATSIAEIRLFDEDEKAKSVFTN